MEQNNPNLQSNRSILFSSTGLIILGVMAVALFARFGFLAWHGVRMGGDSGDYLRLAQNLLNYGVFSLGTESPFNPSIRRAPAYSTFIALLSWPAGMSLSFIVFVQIVLDAIVALMVFLLARMIVPLKWATASGLIYAIHPGAVVYSNTILSESLSAFLLASAVLAIVYGLQKNNLIITATAGALVGLAALCRPAILLLPFLLVGMMLFLFKLPSRYLHTALLSGCFLIIVAPWIIRCTAVTGRFVSVQVGSGMQFYMAARWDWNQTDETEIVSNFFKNNPQTIYAFGDHPPDKMHEFDRQMLSQAIELIKANPDKYIASRARYFPHLFITSFDFATGIHKPFGQFFSSWQDVPKLILKSSLLIFFSLGPFLLGIVGVVRAKKHIAGAVCAIVWLYNLAVHFPLWVEYRYWQPVTPLLLVTAVAGLWLLSTQATQLFASKALESKPAA